MNIRCQLGPTDIYKMVIKELTARGLPPTNLEFKFKETSDGDTYFEGLEFDMEVKDVKP